MKTIQYIKIKPFGSFSSIQDKTEYKVIEYREEDILCRVKNKRSIYIIPYSHIFNFSESQYTKNGDFLGSITEVEGGFIPENSITHYFGSKVYKTKKDAYKYLFNKMYEKKRKAIFGCLARSEFYYTENYIKDKSINELVSELKIQFMLSAVTNSQIVKIIKNYFKSEVIDYAGQGGYKTKSQIFYSNF